MMKRKEVKGADLKHVTSSSGMGMYSYQGSRILQNSEVNRALSSAQIHPMGRTVTPKHTLKAGYLKRGIFFNVQVNLIDHARPNTPRTNRI